MPEPVIKDELKKWNKNFRLEYSVRKNRTSYSVKYATNVLKPRTLYK